MADQREGLPTRKEPGRSRRRLRSANERMLAGGRGRTRRLLQGRPDAGQARLRRRRLLRRLRRARLPGDGGDRPQDDGSGRAGQRPAAADLGGDPARDRGLVVLPGPFWGWGHGWWGWIAPLARRPHPGGGGVLAYRAISGSAPRGEPERARGQSAASSGETAETEVILQPPRIVLRDRDRDPDPRRDRGRLLRLACEPVQAATGAARSSPGS